MILNIKCVGIHTKLYKTGPIGDMGFPIHADTTEDTFVERHDVDFVIKDKNNSINLYLPDRVKNEFILGKWYELEIREVK